MGELDQSLKRLVQLAPQDFLDLALPGSEFIGMMPTDVAVERQQVLDDLIHIRAFSIECLVNFEFQSGGEAGINKRLHNYGGRASFIYDLPVLSVVYWLQAKGIIPEPFFEQRIGPYVVAQSHFIFIKLFELDASEIVKTNVFGLLPLLPFMRGADQQLEATAMARITREAPRELMTSLATILAVFIARQYNSDIALSILRRFIVSDQLLEESPLYRLWRDEAIAKGLAEGLAEGKAQGRASGMRMLLQEAMAAKFGSLSPEVIALLERANEAALVDVVTHLALESLEQVQQRLQSQP